MSQQEMAELESVRLRRLAEQAAAAPRPHETQADEDGAVMRLAAQQALDQAERRLKHEYAE